MTDKRTQEQAPQSNMEKDPEDWVTGDEPMTGAQRSYLKTLSEEAREPFDDSLTKAQASQRIDELQAVTGRGRSRDNTGGQTNDQAAGDKPEEGPLQSIGRAVGETVLGAEPAGSGQSDRPRS
ncbi:MAG TPA: DUF3072 domain-containing protein [Rubrivivax sp.]|nr:DUF3072 domain-containing protein [Rubrivivax sp.]